MCLKPLRIEIIKLPFKKFIRECEMSTNNNKKNTLVKDQQKRLNLFDYSLLSSQGIKA